MTIRLQGYMFKLPVTSKFKRWSKRWFVLYDTSLDGIVRIDYYDDESKFVSNLEKRTIPLRAYEDLQQISGDETHSFLFEFTTQIGNVNYCILGMLPAHLNQWMEAIKDAVHRDRMKMRKAKSKSVFREAEGVDIPLSGVYRVYVEENETSQRLNISGAYNLEVTPEHITLVSADSKAQIAKWYYKDLKNYGKKTGLVSFETGAKAETGQGKFVFKSMCSIELFKTLDANIQKLCREKNKKDIAEALTTVENVKKQKSKEKRFSHSNSSYDTRAEMQEGTQGAYHTKRADPFDTGSVFDSLESHPLPTSHKGGSQRPVSSEGIKLNHAAACTDPQPLTQGAHNPLDQMNASIDVDDIDDALIEILANMEEDQSAGPESLGPSSAGHALSSLARPLSPAELDKEWEKICSSLPQPHDF